MSGEVVSFPTSRKRPYQTDAEALRILRASRPANLVSITDALRDHPPVSEPEPAAVAFASKGVEMALLLAILSALSVGNDRDRKLFGLVGWELGRLAGRFPADEHVAEAIDLLVRLREVNYGR